MSSTYGTYRTAEEIAAEQLRDKEAERRRLEAANQDLAGLANEYSALQKRLDEAATRLPDVHYQLKEIPVAAPDLNSSALANHVNTVRNMLVKYKTEVNDAIQQAEVILQTRIKFAQAMKSIQTNLSALELLTQAISINAKKLNESMPVGSFNVPKINPLDIVAADQVLIALKNHLSLCRETAKSLANRVATKDKLVALSGDTVTKRHGAEAQRQYAEQKRNEEISFINQKITELLRAKNLTDNDLSPAIKEVLSTVAESIGKDGLILINDWMARIALRKEYAVKAKKFMEAPPSLAYTDEGISKRWATLVTELQKFCNMEATYDFNRLTAEYRQINTDCKRIIKQRFVLEDWLVSLRKAGFDVVTGSEQGIGADFQISDPSSPETFVLGRIIESKDGDLQVKTDLYRDVSAKPASKAEDEKAIRDTCKKLKQAAQQLDKKAQGDGQAMAEEAPLPRKPRPIPQLKASFAQAPR